MDDSKAFCLADNLRSFAEFIDEHAASLPEDITIDCYTYVWDWDQDASVPEVLAKAMRAGVKGATKIEKDGNGSYFKLFMEFGNKHPLEYRLTCNRDEVCTKRVVGTERVTKKIPPEGDWTEKEVDQDIVEWDCNPLLAVVIDKPVNA